MKYDVEKHRILSRSLKQDKSACKSSIICVLQLLLCDIDICIRNPISYYAARSRSCDVNNEAKMYGLREKRNIIKVID